MPKREHTEERIVAVLRTGAIRRGGGGYLSEGEDQRSGEPENEERRPNSENGLALACCVGKASHWLAGSMRCFCPLDSPCRYLIFTQTRVYP
jgi:hypothetical protein